MFPRLVLPSSARFHHTVIALSILCFAQICAPPLHRVGFVLREEVKGQLLGAALSQETCRSCAWQNSVLTSFLFAHSESHCLLLRGQQKEVKAQLRDFNVRQAEHGVFSWLGHTVSPNLLGPWTTGMSRNSTVCSCPQLSRCLLRPRLQEEVEAPPHEKAEAQHYGEDLSNCNVGCCAGQTRVNGLFLLGHTNVSVSSSSWSTEKSKLSFAGRLVCDLKR